MSDWKLDRIEIKQGRLTDVYTPTYEMPDHPVWVECDFCDQKTKYATFRLSYAFTFLPPQELGYRSMQYDPGLAICPQCLPLVESKDWRSTAARQLVFGAEEYNPFVRKTVEEFHRCLMLSFADALPIEWESGQRVPQIPKHLMVPK